MAHFAKIVENNIVIDIEVVNENHVATEAKGIAFQKNLTGYAHWVQTSKNTLHGVHALGGTPLRKNYASIGGTYDEARDAFIDRKIFPSWILNEETCAWEAPTPMPEDGGYYQWNETTKEWDELTGQNAGADPFGEYDGGPA